MKSLFSYTLLPVFLFASVVSIAQNNILAGKITDENNNPLPNTIVKLQDAQKHIIATQTDRDGLYYTHLLSQGKYTVTIVSNNKEIQAKEIMLAANRKENNFYNFCLKHKKATLTVTTQNPFTTTELAKLQSEDPRKDVLYSKPGTTAIIKANIEGQINSISFPPEGAPKMK